MDELRYEVKRLRRERGWTQAELGIRAGLTQPFVTHIESGRRTPSLAVVEKLAEAFEVEVADLFPKVESPLPLVFEEERNRGGGHDIRITATDSAGAVDSGELKLKHWFDAIVAELEVRGRYEEAEEVGRMRDRVLMA